MKTDIFAAKIKKKRKSSNGSIDPILWIHGRSPLDCTYKFTSKHQLYRCIGKYAICIVHLERTMF